MLSEPILQRTTTLSTLLLDSGSHDEDIVPQKGVNVLAPDPTSASERVTSLYIRVGALAIL